jgi:hypothetical protein
MSDEELSKKVAETVKKLNHLLMEASNKGLEVHYIIDKKTCKWPLFDIRLLKEI